MKNLGHIQNDNDIITLRYLNKAFSDNKIYLGEGAPNGVLCEHPSPNTFIIPKASNTALGVVKGNDNVNGVLINENGALVVHSVDITKIHQPDNHELIINCGQAPMN